MEVKLEEPTITEKCYELTRKAQQMKYKRKFTNALKKEDIKKGVEGYKRLMEQPK